MSILKKPAVVIVLLLALLLAAFFLYIKMAFPAVRDKAITHLTPPPELSECVDCHAKVSPQVAQDWTESKHGLLLVKCIVCHGETDGSGALPFAARPTPEVVCAPCHQPSIDGMVKKFGINPDCYSCHPYHQNGLHGNVLEKRASAKSL